jgi:hypothetical protein
MNIFEEYERELEAKSNTPEAKAEFKRQCEKASQRLKKEHERGVRLGWFDEDGNPLEEDDEDQDDEEDES